MIRHVALFRWKPEATDEQKERVPAALATLPSTVPSIRAFTAGADAGINQGNFDFAVTADFDDEPGYLAYRDDPGHRQIWTDVIAPVVAERASVQLQF
jgi:stress responsive alpha/beta barrel protein